MKRLLKGLAICVAGAAIVLGASALLFPVQPAGRLFPGSGVYIGDGIILSNQHILKFHGERMAFSIPAWGYFLDAIDAPVQEVIYENRDLELAIARLRPSLLSFARVAAPCLSTQAVRQGETLEVISSPRGTFPPVSAKLVVREARPLMRVDLDPRTKDEARYAAMTIVTTLSADQAGLVGPGSSGGPVLNSHGALVGLVWTGRGFGEGSAEIWVTPVSAWLSRLQAAEIPEDVLEVILDARCAETGPE